jgi:uncharacterized iron-regulated membrane protein
LHFGRFSGWPVKALWTVLGLAPALLAITGTLMWWRRVVRGKLHSRRQQQSIRAATPPVERSLLSDEANEAL